MDAFLEAHDSGLTEEDKRVANGVSLHCLFVCSQLIPLRSFECEACKVITGMYTKQCWIFFCNNGI